MKMAIVYDWVDKWGGVERILLALNKIFPQADFFTSYYDKKKALWARKLKFKSSFIEHLPFFIKKKRLFSLPFYPMAFESFNFDEYDLVISVTSAFAKGIIAKPKTYHICYLLTPTRFLWVMPENYDLIGFKKKLLLPYVAYLREWDYVAAHRPDKIISISRTAAKRCLDIYQLPSQIIYPPFDYEYWLNINEKLIKNYFSISRKFYKLENKEFFLVVSRLENYKKVDLVIRVFNQIGDFLVIVGQGSQEKKLKKMAKKNIFFYKNLTDEELGYLYKKAEALITPQEEDFGYVALESQFFSCPIVAFKKGGVTETLFDGKTGLFFNYQKEDEIIFTIERFKKLKYNLKNYLDNNKKHLLYKFSYNNFKKKIKKLIGKNL